MQTAAVKEKQRIRKTRQKTESKGRGKSNHFNNNIKCELIQSKGSYFQTRFKIKNMKRR